MGGACIRFGVLPGNGGVVMTDFAVVFDLDGTLADSMGAWRGLEADLCRMSGIEDTPQVMRDLCSLTIPEVAAYFHEGYGLKASNEEVVQLMNEIMCQRYAQDVEAKPGALALVRALHAAGVPMAVASSTPHHLLDIGLEALGMAEFIGAVVSVDDVGHSKREPHAFLRAAELLGATAANTVVVEDSAYAVCTANQAGFGSFGVYDMDESATIAQLQDLACDWALGLEDVTVGRLQQVAKGPRR